MPNFVETYNAEMRAALFSAAIDRGLGVRGALRAAGAGELPDLEPASQAVLSRMAYGYAAELVRDERERRGVVRQVRDDVTELAHTMAARLAALADRELRLLEAAKVKLPVDTGRAHAAAKLMREALALARDAQAPAKGNGKTSGPAAASEPARPRSVAAMIASDDTAADDAQDHESASGDTSAPRTTTTTEPTHDRSAGAVRGNVAARGGAGALQAGV